MTASPREQIKRLAIDKGAANVGIAWRYGSTKGQRRRLARLAASTFAVLGSSATQQ